MLSNVMVWNAGMALMHGEWYRSPAEDNADGTVEWRVIHSKELFGSKKGADLASVTLGDFGPTTFGGCPILLQAGEVEGFMEDILPFAERAAAVTSCRLEVYEEMIHVFPMFSSVLGEGRLANTRWTEFCIEVFDGRCDNHSPGYYFISLTGGAKRLPWSL
ncbi:hypothetical protein FOZ61_001881 [Perkinsus olseni]|uniref:Alpha/beta hydrolase fold-3 domain-containing protein n=1 Tax=Perkinsus olseni TaxID=32597 RepID=A0A7J6KPH3_PEROL|nr:hypothetical protein FOZ61_001881 [Perkinsus olseni]KAF4649554.1 hypothetical protein FOL46_001687 [Perkinsus olseni]